LIINYDGKQYPFDMDDVEILQALAIEKHMGCSFDEWGKKLQKGDMKARQVLGWLILHPAGEVPVEATNFKMVALGKALDAAYAAETPAEAEPNPTAAAAESNGHAPAAAASSPVSLPPSSEEISR
jgi:hypothetical protein